MQSARLKRAGIARCLLEARDFSHVRLHIKDTNLTCPSIQSPISPITLPIVNAAKIVPIPNPSRCPKINRNLESWKILENHFSALTVKLKFYNLFIYSPL